MNSNTDRFLLFDKLSELRLETAGFNYRGINLVDAALSPLYLSLLDLYNNSGNTTADSSLLNKINDFSKRIKDKIARTKNASIAGKLIEESQHDYRATKYLFFPVEPTHLHQMIPVLRVMEDNKEDFLVVTNRLLIYTSLKDIGFKPVLISYPQKEDGYAIGDLFEKANITALEQAIENNVGSPFSKRFFKATKDIFEHYTVPFIHQFEELLSFIRPVAVIVGYDITLEGRILTLLCKQRTIRSVCIQHGSISGEPLDHNHIVDQFLLYGDAAKDYLVDRGFSAASCVVTGAPYLDGIAVNDRPNGRELKKLLNVNSSKPYILIALSGPGHSTSKEHFNRIVLKLLEATTKFQDYQFVAKLHRKDKLENYQALIDKVPDHQLKIIENQTFSFEIFDWLDGCSLLITGASTVAQEAMLVGIPVMTIDLMNEYRDVDFIEEGCTIHVIDENEIADTIQSIISYEQTHQDIKGNARKYSEYFFYKLDSKAAIRCASIITGNV